MNQPALLRCLREVAEQLPSLFASGGALCVHYTLESLPPVAPSRPPACPTALNTRVRRQFTWRPPLWFVRLHWIIQTAVVPAARAVARSLFVWGVARLLRICA